MGRYSHIARNAIENNVVKGIAANVFTILCNHPGVTVGELAEFYTRNYDEKPRNELAKRVSDLAQMGAIKASGEKKCSVTGKIVKTWEPTGKTPVKLQKTVRLVDRAESFDEPEFMPAAVLHITNLDLTLLYSLIAGCRAINTRYTNSFFFRLFVPKKLNDLAFCIGAMLERLYAQV